MSAYYRILPTGIDVFHNNKMLEGMAYYTETEKNGTLWLNPTRK